MLFFVQNKIIIVLLNEPLAKYPSGRTAKDSTELVWPVSVFNSIPLTVSQILIFESYEPLAKYPSGRTAKDSTQLVWPVSVLFIFPAMLV